MAIQGLVVAVKDALAVGLGSIAVHNRRVPPGLTEADLPLVVFLLNQTTGKAFFGGVEEDHFATVAVLCFGQADKGATALRAVEEAVYAALDRKTLAGVTGYEGVQGLALVRGDPVQVEPNMYVCRDSYVVFGSVDVP